MSPGNAVKGLTKFSARIRLLTVLLSSSVHIRLWQEFEGQVAGSLGGRLPGLLFVWSFATGQSCLAKRCAQGNLTSATWPRQTWPRQP